MIWAALAGSLVTLLAVLAVGYGLTVTGRMNFDTGWGRRVRPLGPQVVRITAPRSTVFDMIGVPYLSPHPPRALRDKVEVLERAGDMVLAAHRTDAGRFTTVTVETVTFEPPERVGFRLVRGPVPFVVEHFVLRETDAGTATELEYEGQLGTDGWAVGAAWGNLVARYWERTVAASLASLKESAERSQKRHPPLDSPRPQEGEGMQRSNEVLAAMIRFYERLSASDVASFDEIVSADPNTVVVGTAPGEIHRERAALRFGFETEGVRFQAGPSPEGWAEGSMGWVLDEPTLFFPGDDVGIRTRLTAVFQREDGAWKMVHMHTSAGVPDEEVLALQARWLA